jgi:opacity protein-like surface antigen
MRYSGLSILVLLLCSATALAQSGDVTIFGGMQHSGKITFQGLPSATTNLVQNFDPRTFGVYGLRFDHGHILGGEHTIAYSPSFVNGGTNAFFYNSGLLVQAPLPLLRPYATAGIGLVHTGGSGLAVFGTKFAVDYGGGVKFKPLGPIGARLDIRGYSIPSVKFEKVTIQEKGLNFFEVTAGVVFFF